MTNIKAILAQRELARRRMEYFVPFVTANYEMGKVHRLICSTLDWVLAQSRAKKRPRIILTVPPRHGKSTLASQKFPAFCLGKYPDMQIIGASYSTDLAENMNREVQNTIASDKYKLLFDIELNRKGTNKMTMEEFTIPGHKGSYKAAGVGSGITGRGADLLIVDDPIKDMKEADSKLIRDGVYDWFYSTAYTRLSAGAGVILIQTRWHQDDLAGRLLNPEGDTGEEWRLINFPAIAEKDEYHNNELFRKEGEALHEERIPLDYLNNVKKVQPQRIWAALYQQNPMAKGGNVFQEDWFKLIDLMPAWYERQVISVDCTFKDTDGTDYVVFQCWGQQKGNFYLIDQVRARMDFVHTVENLYQFCLKHPNAHAKLIEEKANGAAVINMLQSKVWGLIPIVPKGSKEARAHSVSPLFKAGNVYVNNQPFTKDYLQEMMSFPNGTNDDQVDCTSQALQYLAGDGIAVWQSEKLAQ